MLIARGGPFSRKTHFNHYHFNRHDSGRHHESSINRSDKTWCHMSLLVSSVEPRQHVRNVSFFVREESTIRDILDREIFRFDHLCDPVAFRCVPDRSFIVVDSGPDRQRASIVHSQFIRLLFQLNLCNPFSTQMNCSTHILAAIISVLHVSSVTAFCVLLLSRKRHLFR